MTSDKLFNIFSCSKVATVTAALILHEKGFFLLDDPLYDFIPEFRDMYIRNSDGRVTKAQNSITLRHLFTMTAGFTYDTSTPGFQEAKRLTDGRMDTLTVARCIAGDFLSFEPGTRWQYSICHDILAAVVEVITGMKFSDFVKQNIFEPLNMKESFYHNEEVIDRVATMYSYVNSSETDLVRLQSEATNMSDGKAVDVGKKVSLVFGSRYDSGGAGITTSVSDYSKFASALACGGVGATGERIISPASIELMRTNQLSQEQKASFTWSQLRGYGYGLGVRTMTDKALGGSIGSIGEFGWGGAAGATLLCDPSLKLSVFYTHHMLNPQEEYYQPRLRNVVYSCL